MKFNEHPLRVPLTNEMHARPFQSLGAPGRALSVAFKPQTAAAERSPETDRAHLCILLDKYGAAYPPPGARQHSVDLNRVRLKWECHTEFVSYTLFETGTTDTLFAGRLMEFFDADWMNDAPGPVISAIECEVFRSEATDLREYFSTIMARHFDLESLAASEVLEQAAVVAGDFRIHEQGLTRFAVVVTGDVGPLRLGRVVQRLFEIETYRAMAVLALPMAIKISGRLNEIERRLAELIADVNKDAADRAKDDIILGELMTLSAEIGAMSASSAFRFGASGAYETIIAERLDAMAETSLSGRQKLRDFLTRRFSPAMRTMQAAESRIEALSIRAARAAELLRTRVNVKLEAQNADLLESMDRRAALQLRLQETVEGLSVVAISYYAVSLAAYLGGPLAEAVGVSKTLLLAILTLPVVLLVWWFVRRIRKRISKREAARNTV